MSRRHDLEWQRHQLNDLNKILGSIKALAFMETRKIGNMISNLHGLVQQIENAAATFLAFHPEFRAKQPGTTVTVVIGSERGFCGDFNERLLPVLPVTDGPVIAVGRKLEALLAEHHDHLTLLPGSNIAEETSDVLGKLTDTLASLSREVGSLSLSVLYQADNREAPTLTALLPPFANLPAQPARGLPPYLNLSPTEFFAGLTEQYVLASLNRMLYSALLAENHRRVQHLEGAVRHLQENVSTLGQKLNTLRQEEITEEIEVILLSAEPDSEATESPGRP
ncbi:F0F1 ATP synthase subunit gamma [Mangrovitalea sediminis]|uniref:F0F1 ATP synthase subunit gamma n=1 Tax=Mangrovitalea sediminis TaxID=1982043 RepID=UPI00130449A6|nr:F0F1 ATP synthase subunit gamma [Mangrovitalea sediminis]